MSEQDGDLFEGEDVEVDLYDVDRDVDDALGLRGDLVREISSIHDCFSEVLDDSWDFEVMTGDSWWNFTASYEGENGEIVVSGSRKGKIEVDYLMNDFSSNPPRYVEDEIEFLGLDKYDEIITRMERSVVGVNMTMDREVDLEEDNVERYIKDVAGLYAGIDRDL